MWDFGFCHLATRHGGEIILGLPFLGIFSFNRLKFTINVLKKKFLSLEFKHVYVRVLTYDTSQVNSAWTSFFFISDTTRVEYFLTERNFAYKMPIKNSDLHKPSAKKEVRGY